MELTKKGINASSVTREEAYESQKNDLDSSELGYVVLIQVFLFLISLVMMVR
jgi:hypothetical protein